MKTLITALMTALFLVATPGFSAEEVKCTCDHKCAETCKQGKGEKSCDCKACDCAKTGSCPHHKCGGEEKKEAPKK